MTNAQKVDPNAPLREGEFRRIKGIAENTERSLHQAGIETFDHLAMLAPEEIASALPGVVGVKERSARQDWAGQAVNFARLLARQRLEEQAPGGAEELEDLLPEHQQHYASFLVVLLLDEEQNVRRTTVTHVQDDLRESWAGWEPQRMTGWITEQAGMISAQPAHHPLAENPPEALPEAETAGEPVSEPQPPGPLGGKLLFGQVKLLSSVNKRSRAAIYAQDPFIVSLMMDTSQVQAAPLTVLRYYATAQVRRMGEWRQPETIRLEGETRPEEMIRLEFPLPGLPEGAYHLDIAVLVAPEHSASPEADGLSAMSEGFLLRVQAEELVSL